MIDKIYKAAIGISLIIVALALAFYFAVYLPQKNSQDRLAANQSACSQMEGKIKTDYEGEYSGMATYTGSSNHYDEKLQKCIVYISYDFNSGPAHSIEDVLDAGQDEDMLHCDETVLDDVEQNRCSSNGSQISYAQFTALEKQYMNE